MAEPCTPQIADTLVELTDLIDTLTLDWIANLGEEVIPRQYEFSTSDKDLLDKMKVLARSSKKFADETVFWEVYYCEACDKVHPEYPVHIRVSEVA